MSTVFKYGFFICAIFGAAGIALVVLALLIAGAVGLIDGMNKRQQLRRQAWEAAERRVRMEATIAAALADLDAELIELPLSPDGGDQP